MISIYVHVFPYLTDSVTVRAHTMERRECGVCDSWKGESYTHISSKGRFIKWT